MADGWWQTNHFKPVTDFVANLIARWFKCQHFILTGLAENGLS